MGIAEANVLALFPNKTWKQAITDETGTAILDLHSAHLPMTIFVAAVGFAAYSMPNFIPAQGTLDVHMISLADGGAVIFSIAQGYLPGLEGRLNPIRDTLDRTYLYANNIAINGGLQQPVQFALGEDLHLCDAEGKETLVRIVDIVGRSALVEFQHVTDSRSSR